MQNRKPVRGASVTAHVYAIADRVSSTKVASIPLLDEGLAGKRVPDAIHESRVSRILSPQT